MTGRPLLGQRPTRPPSTTTIPQRPPSHRTLSQQFPSGSPARRGGGGNEGFVDLTLESDVAGRYGTVPRMGSSRLRLEISDSSNDSDASPKQHSDATTPWRTSVLPRGRPQLHFDVPNSSNPGFSASQQEAAHNEVNNKAMPLPVRPGQHAPPTAEKARSALGNSAKKEGRPKPYVLEVPTLAPRYPPNGHADFYPWTGNHPEDQFSEPVIRQGYFDKAQMTQNETGTARAAISPALKHKTGLQTLSSLFTDVLAQRRSHGQVTASWAFKPPPRVTVTDTKREIWLKDLANPTISLKRLSRSIPHGIRGKVLLDQSLSKNIPIERAVWLAKCVGANELRSFRRKGVSGTFQMGGEAKWIRDFTVCVEQFVENVVGSCGEGDFKGRINYVIRLAAHFHAEYLLDREHYMDWLVSSLENSPQAKLPLWILITQVYWKDLVKYRKYGRRLAGALLGHVSELADHPDHDILEPLLDRLQQLLKGLMISNPDSFVSPRLWAKHEHAIRSSLLSDDSQFLAVFEKISLRNKRLTIPGIEKKSTARQRLIRLLDMNLTDSSMHDVPKRCWQVDEDKTMLLQAVLEWSTSSYRPGSSKIFVAARILRFWSKSGVDVTESILDFLDSDVVRFGRNKTSFYHLVSELARSEHFSTPRYLQWLISRGGLYGATDAASDGPCATRLLAELPLHNLSDGMISLHRTLLDRAGFSVDEEEQRMRICMASMNRTLPSIQANADLELELDNLPTSDDLSVLVAQLSRSSKSEIGLWLRYKVRVQMQQPTIPLLEDWDTSPMKGGTSAITVSDFYTFRNYLELIDDYSMLADVLKIVASSNDAEVLASCADTINLHTDTFAAIGALHGLFDILTARLPVLVEDQDFIPRIVLVSLSDLAARIPERKSIADQLSQELAMSDRKNAADACSPVSDHMAMMQITETDFTDEIEKVLASGNSMDQATLDRLFQRVVLQLEMVWEKSPEQQRSCGLLLTRLRTFDAQHFDSIMHNWTVRFLNMTDRPNMIRILGPLISFGCLSFQSVLASCEALNEKDALSTQRSTSGASKELLVLLLGPSNLLGSMGVEELYRFRIKQAHVQMDFAVEVLATIRQALEIHHTSEGGDTYDANARMLLESRSSWELFQKYALLHTDSMIQALVIPMLPESGSPNAVSVSSIVDKLLLGDSQREDITTEAILDIANDLTLPFCQIKLESMFTSEDSLMSGTEEGRSERLEAFDSAIEAAVDSGKTAWASIVPLLDKSIAYHLRRRAQIQFLALFPSPKSALAYDSSALQGRLIHAENLLRIIDTTARSATAPTPMSSDHTSLAVDIITTLSGVRILLSTSHAKQIKDALVTKWIPLLLSFITMHTSEFEATRSGHESRAKAILALLAIMLELQALDTSTEAINGLIEHNFDLALYLVDPLPDDMRQQCIRSLRDTVSSPQLHYIFSFAANPSEWLVLSQKESIPVSNGGPGDGGTDKRSQEKEKLTPFPLRKWELLGDSTPHFGENDTSLSLTLFGARRG
ncbi:Mediator of RNA polymerase II transcription subunit [Lachnellula subtilissima]|uniref:Mediator of RNA polymerase II transcription subunit 12 n=1 Tax=Lachnellula subtilissima TaxID=602034 RepID=A0A8H8RNC2_9HELO|nr:Mediator of RNA polymerase II transcription subunit [Lachnellula subtilissima]